MFNRFVYSYLRRTDTPPYRHPAGGAGRRARPAAGRPACLPANKSTKRWRVSRLTSRTDWGQTNCFIRPDRLASGLSDSSLDFLGRSLATLLAIVRPVTTGYESEDGIGRELGKATVRPGDPTDGASGQSAREPSSMAMDTVNLDSECSSRDIRYDARQIS